MTIPFSVSTGNLKRPVWFLLRSTCLLLMFNYLFLSSTPLWAWEKIDIKKTPSWETFPHSDAVIIKDEAIMEINSNGEVDFTHHMIMKIFSDPDKRYSHQEIPFNNSVKVIKIDARTIHPDGEQILMNPSDVRERSLLSESVLYSDAKVKEFYFPRVEKNCLVEYEYILHLSSLLYWADWFFQSYLPTLHSKYTLITPKHMDYNVKVLNDRIVPMIDFDKGKKIFVWETTEKKAIDQEPFMPPVADVASRLAFSPLEFKFDDKIHPSADWDDIAQWYWEISQAVIVPSQELNLLAYDLTSKSDSNQKKMKAIFDHIQERIRYVSIAIGTGAFKPHPCSDVLKYGYGDCKDMTSLLIALLRAVNIEAFPALLLTKGHRSLLSDIPKVKQFDHVIVAAPSDEGYIWLDPACRNCRFGELPFEDQGASVLVVKLDKGELTVTPETEEGENFTHTLWEIKLNLDGSASGELTIEAGGQEDLAFRASLTQLKPQRRRKALSGFLSSWMVDPYLVKYEFRNFEEKDSNVFVQASFEAGGLGVEENDRIFLPVNLNTQSYINLMFPQAQRNFPVIFDYKFINTDILALRIPPEFRIEYLPETVRLDEPFGLFESIFTFEDEKIVRTRTFVRNKIEIEVGEYDRLKEFYDRAAEEDSRQIILKRTFNADEIE